MLRRLFFGYVLLILFCLWKVHGTIIAKSDITICENTAKDPLNVLYNKKCEKKMVVLAEVTSGQGETEKLHARINKVRDTVVGEDARLYNPFIITLSMSPIRLVYPIFYRGTLNNKPYEKFFPMERYNCYAEEYPCNAYVDANGKLIWDSWGFCCECQRTGIYATTKMYVFDLAMNNYFRGQIDCDKYLSSAHCMKFDELWYDVHEIDVFTFDFTIWIKAYDQVEKTEHNKTLIEWVDGGEIELSPTKSGGVGKHGRIVAKYIGKMKAGREYPRLQDHYLMTPNTLYIKYGKKYHPQLKHGYEDYLIIPMSEVELHHKTPKCDVIGVSFTAFAHQSTYHGNDGYGCYQPRGTCLRNQIQDYFIEDSMRRERGERTKYFPETYGKITGLKERLGSRDRVLEFESEETSSVMVYLEISADDLILVYNRAGGVIVKAFAEAFESQSRNGLATVVVQNTGFVTADFYVSLEHCSNGINPGHEKTASINPQTNHHFEFTLESYRREGGAFSCTANLYDARRQSIDSSIISVNTTSTCVCVLRCGCSCTNQENFVCVNESDIIFDQGKPPTYTDFMDSISDTLGVIFEAVGDVAKAAFSVVKGVWKLLPQLDKVWSYLTLVFIVIVLVIIRVLCGFLPKGVFKLMAKKTIQAMRNPTKPPPSPAPTVVVIQREDSEEDEAKKTQEFLGISEESGERRKITDFIFEWFFFFIIPFILLLKVFKPIWRKTLRPCFNAGLGWLGKQLASLWNTFYALIKEKLSKIQWRKVAADGNEYDICESGDKRESESSVAGNHESVYVRESNATGSNDIGNNATGSEENGSDVPENDVRDIYIKKSSIERSNINERHLSASDVDKSDFIESSLGRLTGSHLSGINIAGNDVNERNVTGNDDLRSGITTSNIVEDVYKTMYDETGSDVTRSVVTGSYDSGSDVTVRDDVDGSITQTSSSRNNETNVEQ